MRSASICKSLQTHPSVSEKVQLQLRPQSKHPDDSSYGESNPTCRSDFKSSTDMPPAAIEDCAYTRLSQQSLDMCTEVLGSETGTGGCLLDDLDVTMIAETRTRGRFAHAHSHSRTISLPPPLSSLTSDRAVRVTRWTENGRLVLRSAFRPCPRFFLLSRRTNTTDGRRLCIRSFGRRDPPFYVGKTCDRDQEEEEEEESEEESVVEMDEYKGMSAGRCNGEEAVLGGGTELRYHAGSPLTVMSS